MADPCARFLRPEGMGLIIFTSDVSRYDGANLSCISFDPEDGLNGFIAATDSAICALQNSISSINVLGANVSYGGDLVFDCITYTAGSIDSIIEQLTTQYCVTATALDDLTLNDLELGAGLTSTCIGNFLSTANPITVLQAILTELCTTSVLADDIYDDYVPKLTLSEVMGENDMVVTGANKATAGLFLTVSNATYIIDGARFIKLLVANIPLTATADNYVDYDSLTDAYVVTPVTISDPAPAVATGSIRIWMFTTNGLSVVTPNDLRVNGFIDATLIIDRAITTAKLDNLSVTGAKLETIGALTTLGDPLFFEVTYDTKGRVTASSFNIDFTGIAAGDLMQYDGAGWIMFTPNYVDTAGGTAGRVPYFTDANTIANSTIRDNGTVMGINAAVNALYQVNIATTLGYGEFMTSSGANADNYGYYATVSGGTTNNIAYFGKAVGEVAGIVPNNTNIGVVGTAITLNALLAYGGRFGVDGDAASTGQVIALYANAINSGSGEAIGLLVENGGGVFGATTSNASAILELVSTTQGFLPSRMTTAQRDAIAAPGVGLVIFNTTTNKLNLYTGAWEAVTSV